MGVLSFLEAEEKKVADLVDTAVAQAAPPLVTLDPGPADPTIGPVQEALDTFIDAVGLHFAGVPLVHSALNGVKKVVDKIAPVVRTMLAYRGLAIVRIPK